MKRFLRRFSDWLALFGLVFLLIGMLGAARQFKELILVSGADPPEGFLPITVEMETNQHPPPVALAQTEKTDPPKAPTAARPTGTPFHPLPETAAAAPAPTLAVDTGAARAFLPAVSGRAAPDAALTPPPDPTPAVEDPPAAQAAPPSTPTPTPEPVIPDRIEIPAIGLSAPVVPVAPAQVLVGGRRYEQWAAPDQAAGGWHDRSARLFEAGNLVINGHHNIYGSVFASLKDLHPGDEIIVYGGGRADRYVTAQVMILEERYATLDQRAENARWILPSDDRRLTLVTCWPAESNTHRLIVVARPEGNP